MTSLTANCVALVVCSDFVNEGEQLTLRRLVEWIVATRFPHVEPELCFYIVLRGLRGTQQIRLRILRADDLNLVDKDLVEPLEIETECTDPTREQTARMCRSGVVFPQPGKYRIVLEVDGTFVTDRSLELIRRDPQ